jgi:hypothetical protein
VIEEKQILRRLKELKDVVPEGTTVEDLIERAQERESSQDSSVRKQIGVHMDTALWWKFKEQAAKEHMSAGQLLEKLVREYLDKQKE